MSSKIIKSLAFLALATACTASLAQVSGGGVSGVSGVSGGLGIDNFAAHAPGINQEKKGGFVSAVDEAMGGPAKDADTAGCGKLKCDD